mmetsp:Transcript_3647/g.11829  ORF Transcript_3647/g.11829 Transcript_3647/m.11829 type:complete len:258 (-) Transcript_3647:152-925(-)
MFGSSFLCMGGVAEMMAVQTAAITCSFVTSESLGSDSASVSSMDAEYRGGDMRGYNRMLAMKGFRGSTTLLTVKPSTSPRVSLRTHSAGSGSQAVSADLDLKMTGLLFVASPAAGGGRFTSSAGSKVTATLDQYPVKGTNGASVKNSLASCAGIIPEMRLSSSFSARAASFCATSLDGANSLRAPSDPSASDTRKVCPSMDKENATLPCSTVDGRPTAETERRSGMVRSVEPPAPTVFVAQDDAVVPARRAATAYLG